MSNASYQIRTDLPVPVIKPGVKNTYPFDQLPVNAYFTVPAGEDIAKTIDRMKGAAARWRKADESRKGMKFTVAETVVPDDPMGTKVVGVWRSA